MIAILILIVALLLAGTYTHWLHKKGGTNAEFLMSYGLVLLIPYGVIVLGTVVALLVLA